MSIDIRPGGKTEEVIDNKEQQEHRKSKNNLELDSIRSSRVNQLNIESIEVNETKLGINTPNITESNNNTQSRPFSNLIEQQ